MFEEEAVRPLEKSCSEFGLFLNVSGAAEAASNALLDLFLLDERPEHAVEFVRENLNKKINTELDRLTEAVEAAKIELEALKVEIVEERKNALMAKEESDEMSNDGLSRNTIENVVESRDDEADRESISTIGTTKSKEEAKMEPEAEPEVELEDAPEAEETKSSNDQNLDEKRSTDENGK